ncbi:hypothetical protein [Micromonospora zhanjiangensis]
MLSSAARLAATVVSAPLPPATKSQISAGRIPAAARSKSSAVIGSALWSTLARPFPIHRLEVGAAGRPGGRRAGRAPRIFHVIPQVGVLH